MGESDRLTCCVIGCRRTTAQRLHPGASEWLCGVHWRLVSTRIKRLRSRIRREAKRGANTVLDRMDGYLWREAKRQAIERAMGITA